MWNQVKKHTYFFFNFQADLSLYDSVHVVIGNESCDLDSAVCAIIYGSYLNKVCIYREILEFTCM